MRQANSDWDKFLLKVANEIKHGVIWYGRFPLFENNEPVGMWLIMDNYNDLPSNWEYRKHNSNVIFRQEKDLNVDYINIDKFKEVNTLYNSLKETSNDNRNK